MTRALIASLLVSLAACTDAISKIETIDPPSVDSAVVPFNVPSVETSVFDFGKGKFDFVSY